MWHERNGNKTENYNLSIGSKPVPTQYSHGDARQCTSHIQPWGRMPVHLQRTAMGRTPVHLPHTAMGPGRMPVYLPHTAMGMYASAPPTPMHIWGRTPVHLPHTAMGHTPVHLPHTAMGTHASGPPTAICGHGDVHQWTSHIQPWGRIPVDLPHTAMGTYTSGPPTYSHGDVHQWTSHIQPWGRDVCQCTSHSLAGHGDVHQWCHWISLTLDEKLNFLSVLKQEIWSVL